MDDSDEAVKRYAAAATIKWAEMVRTLPSIADVLGLPKPTHVHEWHFEPEVPRPGFVCRTDYCRHNWLEMSQVEAILNEHASTYRVEFEGRPNLSGQAVYSQVTTPWTERQA